jgi:hypothetical protein
MRCEHVLELSEIQLKRSTRTRLPVAAGLSVTPRAMESPTTLRLIIEFAQELRLALGENAFDTAWSERAALPIEYAPHQRRSPQSARPYRTLTSHARIDSPQVIRRA